MTHEMYFIKHCLQRIKLNCKTMFLCTDFRMANALLFIISPWDISLRQMFSQQRYCTDSVIFSQRNCCTEGSLLDLCCTSLCFCELDPKHLYKCGKLKQLACTWLAKYSSVFIMFISVLNDIGPPPMPALAFFLPSFLVHCADLQPLQLRLNPSPTCGQACTIVVSSASSPNILLAYMWIFEYSCHLKLYMIFVCTLLRCSYSEASL